MARPLRPNHPNTWHHVMNRGADRQDVFLTDGDYFMFEWLLADAVSKFVVEVHGYCLMTNHFHLLLHCPEAGLSEAMHAVESNYARWFNFRYGRDGPVFRGRFRSVLVTNDEQLLQTSRYIHRNPLAFVPLSALGTYRWSSLGPYLGGRHTPPWLVVDTVSAQLGNDRRRLWQHVATDQPSDVLRPHTFGEPRALTMDELDAAVSDVAAIGRRAIRQGRSGFSNPARLMAIMLATELRTGLASDIAVHYGLANGQAARSLARRGRTLSSSDDSFRQLRSRVLHRIGNER